MRSFADPRLLAALSFVAWACAKASDTPGSAIELPTGGTTGTAASTSAGGSIGSGASVGTGGNTSGLSAYAGGTTSSGGTTSTAGSTTSGGSNSAAGATDSIDGNAGSGATNEGGASDGIPPVLADTEVAVHYIALETEAMSESVQMRLFFENKSDHTFDLTNVHVRYWMTSEASDFSVNNYYAATATSQLTLAYVDAGKLSYIDVAFTSGALTPHTTDFDATEFQVKLQTTDGETEQQDNDWSFDPTATASPAVANPKITAYVGTKLVWGCEPDGTCAGASGSGGGAGEGQGGEGGEAGQSTQGGQSAQGGSAGQAGDTSSGGQAGI